MASIQSITARKILNSRGEWTIEASLACEDFSVSASVPEGKSKGKFEAISFEAQDAVKAINEKIAPAFKGFDLQDQKKIDERLIEIDGTINKAALGANSTLAVSVAAARAAAKSKKTPLWKYIGEISKRTSKAPDLYMNVINGGLHAGNSLDFQEYIIIPKAGTIIQNIEFGVKVYAELGKELLEHFGKGAALVGDEGGYAPNFENNLQPFEIIETVLAKLDLSDKFNFGLDAAASNIKKTANELSQEYESLLTNHNFKYLEDPFGENDFDPFARFLANYGNKCLIAGDDLTVTNVERMITAHDKASVNAVIIKPNQIGTITEALYAVTKAQEFGWGIVVSHRSGETNDDFIADFAYGIGADGFKLGAPVRGERVAKYNRLMVIENGAVHA